MKVRYGKFDDIPTLVDLNAQTFEEHRERNPEDFPETPEGTFWFRVLKTQFPKRWGLFRKKEAENILVCTSDDEKILGYLLYEEGYIERAKDETRYYRVIDISIFEEHRGNGIGRTLVNKFHNEVSKTEYSYIQAEVWAGNDASENLFASLDYRPSYTAVRLNKPKEDNDVFVLTPET
ncbi:GNAT family N-acetyltransferase [Parasulfitobacter algicola]|uniref:GNAT family N-acetyltransferase n=1 Tax=Parasulfitobacter algicola TaxID=2614809 RepID=A0ABX2IT09_9RHOB|nr:GNAT family N-acetyltransferase [Sulfitobacter algicola]NSX56052.1 GNAT family N-acetyltransferase [Sulfitobacter algicola]